MNLSSDAGLQGNAGAAVYCASKGAVSNLTRALALELAPRGVRVNAVCPADVETPMLRYQAETFGGGDPDGYRRRLLAELPAGPRLASSGPRRSPTLSSTSPSLRPPASPARTCPSTSGSPPEFDPARPRFLRGV